MAGFWDSVLRRSQMTVFTPKVDYIGGTEGLADYIGGAEGVSGASPAYLWRSQPHLRTVVAFLARNVAQLGVHTFERTDETDRRRDRTSTVARALASPDIGMTTYDLIFATVGDMCLYDRAYWYVGPSNLTRSGTILRRLPPSWVSPKTGDDAFMVTEYIVSLDGRSSVTVPAANILDFTGYSPTNPINGSPTVESLRDTLREQIEAAIYRQQVWKRGGRVSAVIQRPAGQKWSDPAREAFRSDWYAKYTGHGNGAGGTPILRRRLPRDTLLRVHRRDLSNLISGESHHSGGQHNRGPFTFPHMVQNVLPADFEVLGDLLRRVHNFFRNVVRHEANARTRTASTAHI